MERRTKFQTGKIKERNVRMMKTGRGIMKIKKKREVLLLFHEFLPPALLPPSAPTQAQSKLKEVC